MTAVVVDASVALSWAFEDEGSGYSTRVLQALAETTAVVPSLWSLEVCNGLVVGERRGRLTEAESVQFLTLLQSLPIELEDIGLNHLSDVATLAREHALSAYDAAYLVVAMRRGLPIATHDQRLRSAAETRGVELFV